MTKHSQLASQCARTVLLALFLFSTSLSIGAEPAPRLSATTLPFGLYFAEEDLPHLRQSIQDGPQQRMWQLLREDCDSFIHGPGFGDLETTLAGDNGIYNFLVLGFRMKELSLAFLLSGDQRYADGGKELMLQACEVSSWISPAHTSSSAEFETGALLQAMVTSLDWLNHSLTGDERQRIVQAIVEKGILPGAGFIADCVADKPSSYARFIRTNNHFAVLCCGFGTAALALRDIDPRADQWLELSVRGMEQFIDLYGYGDDGSYREGALYWSFTTSALLRFIDPLRRLTGRDLFRHSKLKKTLEFRLLLQSPSYSPHAAVNFMDSEYTRGLPAMAVLRLASEYRDRSGMWFYQQIFNRKAALLDPFSDDVVFAILWFDRSLTARPPTYPLRAHFPDIDWVVLRSSWQKDATLFAFKSGNWLFSHDHPDRNSFLLEAFGERLAVDSGCGNYSWPEFAEWQRKTIGHNTLLIDGAGQHPISRGGRPSRLKAGMHRFWPGGPYTYLCSDAAAAYPTDLETNLRHVLFVESRYVVVIDELVKKRKPSTFTWLFHTDNRDGKTVISSPAGDEILIDRPRAGLLLKVVTPQVFDQSVRPGTLDRHRQGSLALSLTAGEGSLNEESGKVEYPQQLTTDFFTILYPFPSGEKRPHFRTLPLDTGHAVEISGGSWRDTIGWQSVGSEPLNLSGIVSDARIAALHAEDGQTGWMGFQDVTQVTDEGRTIFSSDTPVSLKLLLRPEGRTCHLYSDQPTRVRIENHAMELRPFAVPAGASEFECRAGGWKRGGPEYRGPGKHE